MKWNILPWIRSIFQKRPKKQGVFDKNASFRTDPPQKAVSYTHVTPTQQLPGLEHRRKAVYEGPFPQQKISHPHYDKTAVENKLSEPTAIAETDAALRQLLTSREYLLINLAAINATQDEMGSVLNIGREPVRNRLYNAYDKIRGAAELAEYAECITRDSLTAWSNARDPDEIVKLAEKALPKQTPSNARAALEKVVYKASPIPV